METIPIDGVNGYHRDVKTHAVINTNYTEYEAFMRQKTILENAKRTSESQAQTIEALSKDVESLKSLVHQLLNKE